MSAPSPSRRRTVVRNMRPEDFDGIVEIGRLVYPDVPPWTADQLRSHLNVFPEGQFVATEAESGLVLGMCAGLIIRWDDYEMGMDWPSFTDQGMFTNHDPEHGRTLYAADVMVRPGRQGWGIGKRLYERGRFGVARRLGLLRIRAGARLRGYRRHADRLSPEAYVAAVVRGELKDATLSFQLRRGFHVFGVTADYFRGDPESLGHAALIEWLNPEVASAEQVAASTRWTDERRAPES